ncbi:hypothetical protein GCM10028819_39000 [Spirosoma humi]
MKSPNDELISLALTVVEVLDKRCKNGSHKPPWEGFHNENGVEVGSHIERLINKAKRILQAHVP